MVFDQNEPTASFSVPFRPMTARQRQYFPNEVTNPIQSNSGDRNDVAVESEAIPAAQCRGAVPNRNSTWQSLGGLGQTPHATSVNGGGHRPGNWPMTH